MGTGTHAGAKPAAPTLGQQIVNTVGTIVHNIKDRIHLMQLLSAYKDEPAAASKAVRDMTGQEAFDVMLHLVYMGELDLVEPIHTDQKGRITKPRPAQQLLVKTHIAGVDYYRASAKGFVGNYKHPHFAPTPAFAVVLYRLARAMKTSWGASRIVWGGIGAGHDGKSRNCHEVGTCVDFYGAITQRGTFDVLKDWGRKPIFKSDGTPHAKSSDHDDLWGNDVHTYYRLRLFADPWAYLFFASVYAFAHEQCTIGRADFAPSAFAAGGPIGSGTIIHPDYPGSKLRKSHQEHVHFQLGNAYLSENESPKA
jgi:hypothetical protein